MLFAAITFHRLSVQFPGFLYSCGLRRRHSTEKEMGVYKSTIPNLQNSGEKAENVLVIFVSSLFFVFPIVVFLSVYIFLSDFISLSLSVCLSVFLSCAVYPAGCSLASGKSLLLSPHFPVMSISLPVHMQKGTIYCELLTCGGMHTRIYINTTIIRVGSRKVIHEKLLVTNSQVHTNALQHSQEPPSLFESFMYNSDYLFFLLVRRHKGWSGSHSLSFVL